MTADVSGLLPVANGGTNASSASAARTSLGAAASGSNSDITALTGLPAWTTTATPAITFSGGNGSFSYGTTPTREWGYQQIGKIVFARINITLGTSPSLGTASGTVTIPLPVAALTASGNSQLQTISGAANINGTYYRVIGTINGSSIIHIIFKDLSSTGSAYLTAANWATAAASDYIRFTGTYEAA